MIDRAGLSPVLDHVAELGPGDSLGIGLAALLGGARSYSALDAKAHAKVEGNMRVLEELTRLFRERAPIPDSTEFPEIFPRLDNYDFPRHIYSNEKLEAALNPDRIEQIRRALRREAPGAEGVRIEYFTPWEDPRILQPDSVDFIFSQAVLEHVESVDLVYGALQAWLRPGGLMSHTIDFKCHGLTRAWNGHWTLSDPTWAVVKGRRPYLINRLPWSTHRELLARNDFSVLAESRLEDEPMKRERLAPRFRSLSNEDLRTTGIWLLARLAEPNEASRM